MKFLFMFTGGSFHRQQSESVDLIKRNSRHLVTISSVTSLVRVRQYTVCLRLSIDNSIVDGLLSKFLYTSLKIRFHFLSFGTKNFHFQ